MSNDNNDNNESVRQQQQQQPQHAAAAAAISAAVPTEPVAARKRRGQRSHHQQNGRNNAWNQADDMEVHDARPILPKAAFFLGDLRDGLPMINMQAAYLISCKNYTEKQVGALFLAFGLSQFLCMAPAGYFLDYSNRKIQWVQYISVAIAAITLVSTWTAQEVNNNDNDENGGRGNMGFMIFWRILQGGCTAILPPGFNGITLGIVGSTGFTHQVSRNRMMNHIGTALVVAFGSLIAYYLYPTIGALFLVSPLTALGAVHQLRQIVPNHVNRDAARGLILESPTMNEYEWADDVATCKQKASEMLAAETQYALMQREQQHQRNHRSSKSVTSSQHPNHIQHDNNHNTARNTSILTEDSSNLPLQEQQQQDPRIRQPAATTAEPAATPAGDGALIMRSPPPSRDSNGANTGTIIPLQVSPMPRFSPQQQPEPSQQQQQPSTSYQPPDLLSGGLDLPSSSDSNINNINNNNSSSGGGGLNDFFISMSTQQPGRPVDPRARRISHHSIPPAAGATTTTTVAPDGGTTILPPQSAVNRSTSSDNKSYGSQPSFNFGWKSGGASTASSASSKTSSLNSRSGGAARHPPPPRRARTPLAVLMNPTLLIFTTVIFFFHLANSSVLPLVMQSLALSDARSGILLSGLCILIGQAFMALFAKLCGDYSPSWGRKSLMLGGLLALTLRCFVLTVLVSASIAAEQEGDGSGDYKIKALILSTQFLDSVGMGILGTLQILVTADISGGTGRFSLLLGVTTAAMCLGATVSGYLGQALAEDYGYPFAFAALGTISLIPFFTYVFFMPETLPDYARPHPPSNKRQKRIRELFKRLNEHRKRIVSKSPFGGGRSSSPSSNRTTPLRGGGDSALDPAVAAATSSPRRSSPRAEGDDDVADTTPVANGHVELV